jgi:hypothetical protein
MNALQKHTLRRPRAAALAARHVWVIGEENRALLCEQWGHRDVENMIESGATIRSGVTPRAFSGTRPLRPRLERPAHWAQGASDPASRNGAANVPAELVVLGEGAETARWKALAQSLGIAAHTRWLGQLPHAQAQAEVSRADAFVLTSVQEGTPHVVLEALALGVPVLCHDACGMGVAVNESCGIKIAMRDPETSIAGFAKAICLLSQQPARVNEFYRGALRSRRGAELGEQSRADCADVFAAGVEPVPGGEGGMRRPAFVNSVAIDLSSLPDMARLFLLFVTASAGLVTLPQLLSAGPVSGLAVLSIGFCGIAWVLWLAKPWFPLDRWQVLVPLLLFTVYASAA